MSCSSTADIPRGSKPVPEEVGQALRELIRVTAKHGVPLARVLEAPDTRKVREAEELAATRQFLIEKQDRLIDRLRARIAELETQLGIDDEL